MLFTVILLMKAGNGQKHFFLENFCRIVSYYDAKFIPNEVKRIMFVFPISWLDKSFSFNNFHRFVYSCPSQPFLLSQIQTDFELQISIHQLRHVFNCSTVQYLNIWHFTHRKSFPRSSTLIETTHSQLHSATQVRS